MKIPCFVFVAVFIAARAFCGEGLPMLAYGQWAALTNTANFHETHSTTNLPSKVREYILTVIGSMGVQANDRKRIAEPEEPLTAGSRLVWAATDGTNYIVHYEFLYSPDSRRYYTNYCITAGVPDQNDGTIRCCNGGYMRRLKNYKDFIDYERHL
jgi:hypothetical protein